MISRILLGYDGSTASKRAFEFAVDLARRFNADLHILAVARPPDYGTEVETEATIEQGRRHSAHLLQSLKATLEKDSMKASFEVAIEHPSEQILRYAEKHKIDHIVVGHRGNTMFERWLLGSVARQVIAYAHCAVTVIRAVN